MFGFAFNLSLVNRFLFYFLISYDFYFVQTKENYQPFNPAATKQQLHLTYILS